MCGGSPLLRMLEVIVLLRVQHVGEITQGRRKSYTLVLPSLNRNEVFCFFVFSLQSGRFTGEEISVPLVLPSVLFSGFLSVLARVQHVGEIHRRGVF